MHRHGRHPSHSGHQRGPRAAVALSLALLLMAGAPVFAAERAGPGPEPSSQGSGLSGPGVEPADVHSSSSRPGTHASGSGSGSGPGEVVPADAAVPANAAGAEEAISWDDGFGSGDEEREPGRDEDQGSGQGEGSGQDQGSGQGDGSGPDQASREDQAGRPDRDESRDWDDWQDQADWAGQDDRDREGEGEGEARGQEPAREPVPEPRQERENRREPERRQDGTQPQRSAAAPRFKGWAFDTCHTQSADTMRRWLASRYRGVGVYFGGRGRACPNQPLLTRGWLKTVKKQGWKVLPLYVGSQSPCVFGSSKRHVTVGSRPWEQGKTEGADAVRRADALGIRQGSPLYLDVEAYNHLNKKCAKSTLLFVRGWNREVRKRGYLPGFYSSAATGVQHMETARRAGVKDLPSVMWFARWRGKPQLAKEPVLARGAWPKGRIHQYAGNVRERHGGRTLLIDRNAMDAPVARIG
ncbi:DUF1906 domain-containing protein [Streptomyces sp. NPDC005907]|uniref:DUF1906 domain-containing protein n=1 Tax=Streptomyces sp. NPDC005907 TaxID=3154571 RepID=UPI003404D1CE